MEISVDTGMPVMIPKRYPTAIPLLGRKETTVRTGGVEMRILSNFLNTEGRILSICLYTVGVCVFAYGVINEFLFGGIEGLIWVLIGTTFVQTGLLSKISNKLSAHDATTNSAIKTLDKIEAKL